MRLAHNSSITVWSYRDDLDWNSEIVLHKCDVVAELCWKLLLCTAVSEVGVPSLELCIYWLDVRECVEWPLV